ncbi:MAG: phosphatidate cytidylyltransferase [Planctomycetota bacterium]|jgi:phosphatidate cytidylyltransferase
MLKHRLIWGTLMTVLFTGTVILDGWLDGSLTFSAADDNAVQGTILCILIAVVLIPAQLELSALAAARDLKLFVPVSTLASVLFATTWYWPQLLKIPPQIYLCSLAVFCLFGFLLFQYIYYGTSGTLANCGANCFSVFYLGLLSAFVVAVRVDYGPWPLLMFVFVVKSADIGAYAGGTLFGRHQFSPRISPRKTWEGMAAAVVAAIIVAVLFAATFDIMTWWLAPLFGFCFAFLGQLGDLVESMIKRDAQRKDSAAHVPGFGGILDVVDSPLVAAPFAYLFFMFAGANA